MAGKLQIIDRRDLLLPHFVDQIGDRLRTRLRVGRTAGKRCPVAEFVGVRKIAEWELIRHDDQVKIRTVHDIPEFLVEILQLPEVIRLIRLENRRIRRIHLLQRIRDHLRDLHGIHRRRPDMLVILDLVGMVVVRMVMVLHIVVMICMVLRIVVMICMVTVFLVMMRMIMSMIVAGIFHSFHDFLLNDIDIVHHRDDL